MQRLYVFLFQFVRQISSGIRFLAFHKFFRPAFKYKITALLATFGAEIYNPVRAFNYLLVVFNEDHRMAMIDQSVY
jgi:hypothetical protein